MTSSYLHRKFLPYIKAHKVKTIFECGSRDGLDALALYDYYHPERVYAFECNPESILVCRQNVLYNPFIKLIEKAVYNLNGIVDFYPADLERCVDKNIGASSMLWHRDNQVEFFQKHIQVEATRLDTFMTDQHIDRVDMLCMDLQGVELQALEGLGERLNDVRYIIMEVSFESYYAGDHLYDEVRDYLGTRGFEFKIGSGLVANRQAGLTNCLFKNVQCT